MPRRRDYDRMAITNEPRWLTVYNRIGKQLSSRRLEPGTDLRKEIVLEAARWISEGWALEPDDNMTKWGMFHVQRGEERREVSISQSETPRHPNLQ